MYFATKDLNGKNILARQGYPLPQRWQQITMVRALTKTFGPCTIVIPLDELCIKNLLSEKDKNILEAEKGKGDLNVRTKETVNKRPQRWRTRSNRAT